MHILVMEDSPLSARFLIESLVTDGHTCVLAPDGVEAQVILKSQPNSLVISDWEMPRMNGPELCRWARSVEFGRYIYLILLTSPTDHESLLEGNW